MSRRYSSALAALGVTALLTLMLLGTAGGRVRLPVIGLVAVVAFVAGGSLLVRRNRVADLGWAGRLSRQPVAAAPSAALGGPIVRPAATRRQLVFALGRVEARELVMSAWFGAGIGFCVIIFLAFGVLFVDDAERSWTDFFNTSSLLAHPLVGLTIVAAHRAVTRSRRDGTDELFDVCPLPATTRLEAHLSTAWVPVVTFLAFFTVLVTTLAVRNPRVYGPIGPDEVATVLAAVVLCIGGVCLGVALGQYLRWGLVPIVALVGVVVVDDKLTLVGRPHWSNVHDLATWSGVGEQHALLFSDRHLWWRIAWLAGLSAVVAVIAMTHRRRDREVLKAGAIAVAVCVVAGIAVTRPMARADAERLADMVVRPAAHDVCVPAGAGDALVVCAYRPYRDFASLVAGRVAPMASSLPASVGTITLRQVFDGDYTDLPVEVFDRLPGAPPELGPHDPRLSFSSHPGALLANRQLVAFAAVGLPTETGDESRPTVVAGQARGVVAIWLATRGLTGRDLRKLTTGRTSHNGNPGEGPPDVYDLGYAWSAQCHNRDAPVVWSAQDLAAARAVIALPHDRVRAVVHGNWQHWTDSGTGTDELLAALRLPPVGPFDHVVTRPDTC